VDGHPPRTRSRLTRGPWAGVWAQVSAEVSAAAAFLTRLTRTVPADRTTTGAAAFGVIGALVGVAAGGILLVVAPVAPLAAGLLAVAVLAAVSGALHVDGLADTADALGVGDPTRADTARRDPGIGAAGGAAIVVVVGLDAALLAALITTGGAGLAALACIVATAGSRALAPALLVIARERIAPAGSAAWFAAHTTPAAASIALATAAVVALIGEFVVDSVALPVGLVAGVACSWVAAEWLIRRRGALDGDGIGAIVEIAFAAILLAVTLAAGVT
jgi:adenosylcobinamide-GDP ribazoletransferase